MNKTKNGEFHNRISFYDDYAVGQEVWLFYHLESSKPNVCEGIVAGKIMGFEGYAFDMAVIKVDNNLMQVRVRLLNHV